jgi:hypothetical protein
MFYIKLSAFIYLEYYYQYRLRKRGQIPADSKTVMANDHPPAMYEPVSSRVELIVCFHTDLMHGAPKRKSVSEQHHH